MNLHLKSVACISAAAICSLAVLGFQTLNPNVQIKRDRTVSNAKQMGMAMIMYCSDCDDVTPPYTDIAKTQTVLLPYAKNPEIFKTLNPAGGKFMLNMSTVRVSLTSIDRPGETPMTYESKAWADGKRVVCFWDCHVTAVNAAQWKRAQPYLKLKLVKVAKPALKKRGK
jgi:hypothetical protein